MATPTFGQYAAPSSGGPGFNPEGVADRITTLLAVLASGQNPDGTAAPAATTTPIPNVIVNTPADTGATNPGTIEAWLAANGWGQLPSGNIIVYRAVQILNNGSGLQGAMPTPNTQNNQLPNLTESRLIPYTGTAIQSYNSINPVTNLPNQATAVGSTRTDTACSLTSGSTTLNDPGLVNVAGANPASDVGRTIIHANVPVGTYISPGSITLTTAAFTAVASGAGGPTTITATVSGLVSGQGVQLTGGTGNWAGINGTFVASSYTGTTFTVPVDSSGFGAFTSSSPTVHTATATMTAAANATVSNQTVTIGPSVWYSTLILGDSNTANGCWTKWITFDAGLTAPTSYFNACNQGTAFMCQFNGGNTWSFDSSATGGNSASGSGAGVGFDMNDCDSDNSANYKLGLAFTTANCSGISGQPTITTSVANGFQGCVVGQKITDTTTGANVPANTFVQSINSSTSIVLSNNLAGTLALDTMSFTAQASAGVIRFQSGVCNITGGRHTHGRKDIHSSEFQATGGYWTLEDTTAVKAAPHIDIFQNCKFTGVIFSGIQTLAMFRRNTRGASSAPITVDFEGCDFIPSGAGSRNLPIITDLQPQAGQLDPITINGGRIMQFGQSNNSTGVSPFSLIADDARALYVNHLKIDGGGVGQFSIATPSFTATTATDGSANYSVNAFAGARVSAPNGSGFSRLLVVSNTATVLTGINPNNGTGTWQGGTPTGAAYFFIEQTPTPTTATLYGSVSLNGVTTQTAPRRQTACEYLTTFNIAVPTANISAASPTVITGNFPGVAASSIVAIQGITGTGSVLNGIWTVASAVAGTSFTITTNTTGLVYGGSPVVVTPPNSVLADI